MAGTPPAGHIASGGSVFGRFGTGRAHGRLDHRHVGLIPGLTAAAAPTGRGQNDPLGCFGGILTGSGSRLPDCFGGFLTGVGIHLPGPLVGCVGEPLILRLNRLVGGCFLRRGSLFVCGFCALERGQCRRLAQLGRALQIGGNIQITGLGLAVALLLQLLLLGPVQFGGLQVFAVRLPVGIILRILGQIPGGGGSFSSLRGGIGLRRFAVGSAVPRLRGLLHRIPAGIPGVGILHGIVVRRIPLHRLHGAGPGAYALRFGLGRIGLLGIGLFITGGLHRGGEHGREGLIAARAGQGLTADGKAAGRIGHGVVIDAGIAARGLKTACIAAGPAAQHPSGIGRAGAVVNGLMGLGQRLGRGQGRSPGLPVHLPGIGRDQLVVLLPGLLCLPLEMIGCGNGPERVECAAVLVAETELAAFRLQNIIFVPSVHVSTSCNGLKKGFFHHILFLFLCQSNPVDSNNMVCIKCEFCRMSTNVETGRVDISCRIAYDAIERLKVAMYQHLLNVWKDVAM